MNNDKLLEVLDYAVANLPEWMTAAVGWSSLIINRRKPWTYRAFKNFEYEGQNIRVCLHRFETCDEHESFLHPHPWPGAFLIVQGSYLMNIGRSNDLISMPADVAKFVMSEGSRYAIDNPLTWHSVTPLAECYTVMVNGEPWEANVAHSQVRTTKGKDLDSMSDTELEEHFEVFHRKLK